MKPKKIKIKKKFDLFSDYWSPKVVAEMNDYQFKLAKVKGEFVWHNHKETDEVFITGTRKESEFFLNGNLQYECTYKGKNKHGIEWWFDDQRNPLKINFHLNGKTLISHEIQYN